MSMSLPPYLFLSNSNGNYINVALKEHSGYLEYFKSEYLENQNSYIY